MRKLTAILFILAIFAPSLRAVTPEEMEEARTTAALWYLRWSNNGSDYLEQLHPKTMSELEGSLKQKEKDNIKAFKAVAVPKDYASWNQDKLVEYWGVTFFKSAGLDEQGKGARLRVKKQIAKMNIAEPTTAAAAAAATPTEPAATETPAEPAVETPAEVPENPLPTAEEIVQEEATADTAIAPEPEPAPAEKENSASSSTWIYIVALILLIGVVVWLVVFASKTMQKSPESPSPVLPAGEGDETKKSARRIQTPSPVGRDGEGFRDTDSLREKFARTLASKDEEIRMLHREIHDLREECMKLGEENGRLRSDLNITDREMEALRGKLRAMDAVTSAASSVPERAETSPAPTPRRENRHAQSPSPAGRDGEGLEPRTIYLGRVNSKGIFVRADRKPVEGKTVFALTTTDGITGTFRILQFGPTIDMALDNPEYYLAGGCVAPDITDTDDAEGIRTVTAGTAIFEDNCWRLLRKAKIAYE